jgi:hypothetical protein
MDDVAQGRRLDQYLEVLNEIRAALVEKGLIKGAA